MRRRVFVNEYRPRIFSGLLSAVLMFLAIGFLFLDRTGHLSRTIQAYGAGGVVSAMLVMAIFCITPAPSEGLLVMYFKIYGIFLGALCAWTGFMLASFVVFVAARLIGQRLVQAWVKHEYLNAVDDWVAKKEVLGLVVVRLLPIPAFVVNLVTGSLGSVKFWDYTWTSAVTIVPYYIATATMFVGASGKHIYMFLVGVCVFGLTWFIGVWTRLRNKAKHDRVGTDMSVNP